MNRNDEQTEIFYQGQHQQCLQHSTEAELGIIFILMDHSIFTLSQLSPRLFVIYHQSTNRMTYYENNFKNW